MTPDDLIADLRSRINPVYAHQLGTESFERRLCANALEQLTAENAALKEALNVAEVCKFGLKARVERLRGALKTASGWCFDMTDQQTIHMPGNNEWGLRADNLLRWAGDMEA